MTRRAAVAQQITAFGLAAGAGLIIASIFFGGLNTEGIDLSRCGYVAMLLCGATYVSCRFRKLHADELERARQAGYDAGFADGREVRPQIIDFESARSRILLSERGAAQ